MSGEDCVTIPRRLLFNSPPPHQNYLSPLSRHLLDYWQPIFSLRLLTVRPVFSCEHERKRSIWTKRSWFSKASHPCLGPIPFWNVSPNYLCLTSSDTQTDSSLSIRELKILMKIHLRITPHELPVTNMMELLPFRLNSNWVIVALDGLLSKWNKENKK